MNVILYLNQAHLKHIALNWINWFGHKTKQNKTRQGWVSVVDGDAIGHWIEIGDETC